MGQENELGFSSLQPPLILVTILVKSSGPAAIFKLASSVLKTANSSAGHAADEKQKKLVLESNLKTDPVTPSLILILFLSDPYLPQVLKCIADLTL